MSADLKTTYSEIDTKLKEYELDFKSSCMIKDFIINTKDKKSSNTLIIYGKSRTGKTTFVQWLLSYLQYPLHGCTSADPYIAEEEIDSESIQYSIQSGHDFVIYLLDDAKNIGRLSNKIFNIGEEMIFTKANILIVVGMTPEISYSNMILFNKTF
jgi:hypothetical protein